MILGCKGSLILHRLNPRHGILIDSERIGNRTKVLSKRQKAKRNFAEVRGNCCWEVHSKKNGGRIKQLKSVQTYDLSFEVKSAKQIKC